MIFRVELAAEAVKLHHFDVVKTKISKKSKSKKNKGKKYEYFTSASFRSGDTITENGGNCSSNNSNSLLSCRIDPSLLDAHFEIPANELRALSRTNRAECSRITDDGGAKVQKTYFSRRYWRATLNLTIDEIFGKDSSLSSSNAATERLMGLKTPILLLRPDHL